jgi:hypothetical protein
VTKKKSPLDPTYHGAKMRKVKTKQEEGKEKLVSVLDYNQNMI